LAFSFVRHLPFLSYRLGLPTARAAKPICNATNPARKRIVSTFVPLSKEKLPRVWQFLAYL